MKLAFLGLPKLDGNYTHFKYLQKGIPEFQWNLIYPGKINGSIIPEDNFYNIGSELDSKENQKELAEILLDFLIENKYDVVIPMNSPIAISIIPFLPNQIKIVNIVNSNTKRVYKAVTEHSQFISKIICISPEQVCRLRKKTEIDNKVILIPHGVEVDDQKLIKEFPKEGVFKIGFLGRLVHGHKGIFFIPKILKDLDIPYSFEIVGDGNDREEFLKLLEQYNICYEYFGFKDGSDKEDIISKWDILLFPSLVEGFGLSLIETMKYGVIPIANKISGVTDYIIDHGENGFIVDNNKLKEYQNYIRLLYNETQLKTDLESNALEKVRKSFNLTRICSEYKNVLLNIKEQEKAGKRHVFKWVPFKEYRPNLFERLINKLKRI